MLLTIATAAVLRTLDSGHSGRLPRSWGQPGYFRAPRLGWTGRESTRRPVARWASPILCGCRIGRPRYPRPGERRKTTTHTEPRLPPVRLFLHDLARQSPDRLRLVQCGKTLRTP